MRVVAVNIGQPLQVQTGGRSVLTSIFKKPASGPVKVGRLNLEGDRQADLTVHGGFNKAVYVYPSEHYSYWREELRDSELGWGTFGENLTTEGLFESAVHIGDRLQIGSAIFQVSQPRMPCFKLAVRMNRPDMVKRFWASGRSGFYLSVVREGALKAGDGIDRTALGQPPVSVAEMVRLYRDPNPSREELLRALATPLSPEWKTELRERLVLARGL
ncbi:MAG TPA: MOSC domain-containing protein [Bryobacteraceae bacterium]|nr:MOSC domain-containing protein [Bryobacteraceae bacterium]